MKQESEWEIAERGVRARSLTRLVRTPSFEMTPKKASERQENRQEISKPATISLSRLKPGTVNLPS